MRGRFGLVQSLIIALPSLILQLRGAVFDMPDPVAAPEPINVYAAPTPVWRPDGEIDPLATPPNYDPATPKLAYANPYLENPTTLPQAVPPPSDPNPNVYKF